MNAGPAVVRPPGFPWVRWCLFCLIFIGTPLALYWNESFLYLSQERANHQRVLLERLLPTVRVFAELRESREYLGKLLNNSSRYIFKSHTPWRRAKDAIKDLKARFPDAIDFVFLDEKGHVRPEVSDLTFPASLTTAFFRDFAASAGTKSGPFFEHVASYVEILGPMFDPKATRRIEEDLHLSSFHARRGRVSLSRPYPQGMLIAYVSHTPNLEKNCQRHALAKLGGNVPGILVHFDDLREGTGELAGNWKGAERHLKPATARLGLRSHKIVALKDHLWTQHFFTPDVRGVFAIRDNLSPLLRQRLIRLTRMLGLLFLVLSVIVAGLIRFQGIIRLPVAVLLTLLLVYVAGIPLGLLRIANDGRLRERKEALENRLFAGMERQLAEFDLRVHETTGNWERRIRRILSRPARPGLSRRRHLTAQLGLIRRFFHPDILEILDQRGNGYLSATLAWEGDSQKLVSMLGTGISKIFRTINGQPDPEVESARSQIIGITAEFLGFNPDLLLSMFSSTIETVYEMQFNVVRLKILLMPLYQADRTADLLTFIAWEAGKFESIFLEAVLPRYRRWHPETFLWGQARNSKWAIPGRYRFHNCMIAMEGEVERETLPVRKRLVHPGITYYLTGLKGKHLSRFQLYSAVSDRSIRAELRHLQGGFLLVNLAILLVTAGTGWALARSFLDPVRHLSRGLEALKTREFSHRIPPLGNDELGGLGQAFNLMMNDLEDLEMARVIQKTFFPGKPLTVPGGEIFGSYRPASHLGGDYFDYFLLGDGRLFLIIGDVSGHGTSAGLVVAMVKALVRSPDNKPEPEFILGMLQKVLSETLQRIKLMSCLAGIFDPGDATLTLANAGHPPPIKVSGAQSVVLDVKGILLGIRASMSHYAPQRFSLQPGDRVLFYTDGLFEATGKNGQRLEFEAVKDALPALLTGDCATSLDHLAAWNQEVVLPGPQEDDITCMVLRVGTPGEI